MIVLDPGHTYQLAQLDPPLLHGQLLWFVKRTGTKYPGNAEPSYPGTTLQEVLRACLDRARYVNQQERCWQTSISTFLLRWSIWLYEHRAAKRHGRKSPTVAEAVSGRVCPVCGHFMYRGPEHRTGDDRHLSCR